MIKIKPILFNTDMVRAILEDRKTVARRVVKPQPPDNDPHNSCFNYIENGIAHFGMRNRTPHLVKLPYSPGDVLYVRETWQYAYNLDGNEQPVDGTGRYLYAADNEPEPFDFWVNPDGTHRDSMPWRPSIHMPREAARIFLRVTDVRVERLQDIMQSPPGPDNQVVREGLRYGCDFIAVWDSTIKPADRDLYGWDANPWVWVIEFERISKEEAYAHAAK